MAIQLTCECSRALRLKDELAGKKIKCPACSAVLTVPAPEPAADPEAAALDALLQDSEDESPRPRPSYNDERPRPSYTEMPGPAPAPYRPPTVFTPSSASPQKKKERPAKTRSERQRTTSGLVISPGVILGALMMLGAVAWFVIGWAAGFIYFYPPILFVLGLIRFARSLMGQEED